MFCLEPRRGARDARSESLFFIVMTDGVAKLPLNKKLRINLIFLIIYSTDFQETVFLVLHQPVVFCWIKWRFVIQLQTIFNPLVRHCSCLFARRGTKCWHCWKCNADSISTLLYHTCYAAIAWCLRNQCSNEAWQLLRQGRSVLQKASAVFQNL